MASAAAPPAGSPPINAFEHLVDRGFCSPPQFPVFVLGSPRRAETSSLGLKLMDSSGFSWKLDDHPKLPKGKTVAVVVLDGWGEAKPDEYNCVSVAEMPTMNSLKQLIIDAIRQVGGIISSLQIMEMLRIW